jgi:hypothetical protein
MRERNVGRVLSPGSAAYPLKVNFLDSQIFDVFFSSSLFFFSLEPLSTTAKKLVFFVYHCSMLSCLPVCHQSPCTFSRKLESQLCEGNIFEENIRGGVKTVHVVFKYFYRSLRVERGGLCNTFPPTLPHGVTDTLSSSWSMVFYVKTTGALFSSSLFPLWKHSSGCLHRAESFVYLFCKCM